MKPIVFFRQWVNWRKALSVLLLRGDYLNGRHLHRQYSLPMRNLSLIYARSLNHCIGSEGKLPWQLPDDYQFFDDTTRGHAVVMGRRTYEDHNSKLEDRFNLVVTSNARYIAAEGVTVVGSLQAALDLATKCREVFVIGGVPLLVAAFDKADRVYETRINTTVNGDTFLPAFDFSDFETTTVASHPIDQQHAFSFNIYLHQRR